MNFKQTDLQQIFPYDHPYLFYYNFMTLTLKSIQSLEFVNFLYKNFNFGLHLLKMIHLIIQQGIKGILNEIVELFIFFIILSQILPINLFPDLVVLFLLIAN